ncbi:MAG: thioredoxin-dependent thiol peroxidase [Myxococcota bacterium]|nr:thioredoxin-dependent thiol peroxidase [Myxococcota bacterium]
MLTEGTPAPDFTAPTDTGEVTLSALRGQKVVLYFYPRDSTPGCTTEACDFRDLKAEFEAAGAVILGVSSDSVKKHQNFVAKKELNFPLIADTEKEVHEAYGTWVEKKNYGKVYMGTQRSTFLIDEQGVIQKVWPKVRVKGHVDQVLEAVKGL